MMLLPGPPHEMKAMFTRQCLPRLARMVPRQVIRTLVLRVAGMPESDLDQMIAPVYKKYDNPVTTILAAAGDIQIHLRARCPTEGEALALLAEVGGPIELLLGDRIYSRNGQSLEEVVGERLKSRHSTLVVAESCYGGAAGRADHVGARQFGIFSGRVHYLCQPHEGGMAGRAGRDYRRVWRGEQGNRRGDGVGRAAAHRIDLCAGNYRTWPDRIPAARRRQSGRYLWRSRSGAGCRAASPVHR